MAGSFLILQSERGQFRAGGLVIRVKNAPDPQTFRDLDEHRSVFDIDDLPGRRLGDIQRQPKDVRVGLPDVDEAGGNKRIDQPVQLELSNPMHVQFAGWKAPRLMGSFLMAGSSPSKGASIWPEDLMHFEGARYASWQPPGIRFNQP